jgi:hypothetical protein
MDVSIDCRRVVMRRLRAVGAIALGLGLVAPPSGAQTGLVRVYGVGVPGAVTSRWGSRNTVIFNVRVRNDSTDAMPGLIRVELDGVATSSASPIMTIPAGAVTTVPVSVDVDLRGIASGGDRLRFSVVLLNARREELNRFSGTLSVIPVDPTMLARPIGSVLLQPASPIFPQDIAIERVGYAAPRGDEGAGFVVVMKNRGRERWAYTGSLASQVGMGTPETHIEWSHRLILRTAPLPSGLAPGDSAVVLLRLQPITVPGPVMGGIRVAPGLPTELWITVRVYVASSYDVNPSNDALYYVLRMSSDHRVAESRTLPAPGLTIQVR